MEARRGPTLLVTQNAWRVLTPADIQCMAMSDKPTNHKPQKKCLQAALRLLARRDHSRTELSKKLKAQGFSQAHITWATDQACRYNYLDDERFAHDYACRLQRRGYGTRRIRQSLQAKGLAGDLTDKAIARHCTHQAQLEQCRSRLRKKLKSGNPLPSIQALKPKLYRYLLGRGFTASIVAAALKATLEEFDR